jgi:hypothetical protein
MSGKDYGFVPGITPYDRKGHELLKRKPNTTVIPPPTIPHVEAFIKHLDANVAKPVGDLWILAHGNDSGFMRIYLGSSSTKYATYEVLVDIVNDPNQPVRIPASLHTGPFDVHISGCQIGQAEPVVNKIKEAFDSPRKVTAPKHMHIIGPEYKSPFTGLASYEFLRYSFELFRLPGLQPPGTQFRTKPEIVDAFDNQGFRFIRNGATGVPVPRKLWKKVIRKYITITGAAKTYDYFNLGQNIGHGVTRLRLACTFEHRRDPFVYNIPQVVTDPGTQSEMMDKFKANIEANPEFDPAYAFPQYERYGYTNPKDFLDGYSWHCEWLQNNQSMRCTGTRVVYAVKVPITDPATQNLFLNFFPDPVTGTGYSEVKTLKRTDKRLFLRV